MMEKDWGEIGKEFGFNGVSVILFRKQLLDSLVALAR